MAFSVSKSGVGLLGGYVFIATGKRFGLYAVASGDQHYSDRLPDLLPVEKIHNVFEIRARENPDVLLTDHLQIHFLRISEVQKHRLQQLEGIRRDLCD